MSTTKNLLVLPGDGIGQEAMAQVERVANWVGKNRNIGFDMETDLVGGAAYDKHGVALADETLEKALKADAVLLGAVGGPKWDNVAREHRPEAGLLALRKEMDLFANLRPATCMPALASSSTLKEEVVSGLDIMIVRELTAGVYFGQPRGMQPYDGGERCIDTQSYTKAEIERIGEVAFDLARKRNSKVHSVEKANVMETGIFWRKLLTELHKNGGYDVDNAAMQLVKWPKQFDVIVTDNLFGDMLSDTAAMLTGSLGMLPSASLGAADASGKRMAMYEPVHGSAPDIAGQNLANPLASILSFAMCLRYSFDMGAEADLIETASQNVLNANIRTADIMQDGATQVGTKEMGDALLAEMDKLA